VIHSPIKVLFFARLAEQLQCRERLIEWQSEWQQESDLRNFLTALSPHWQVLNQSDIKCAINQTLASRHAPLKPGDEVAYFPPVTGG
jgi:sulfur-carrier protein